MSSVATASVNSPKRKFPLEYTRNIGIAAHIDAGKTTTTERILFYSGVVHKMGEVHEARTQTGWSRSVNVVSRLPPLPSPVIGPTSTDRSLAFSIRLTLLILRPRRFYRRSGALAPSSGWCSRRFCAVAGVQPQSETVWRQMTKYNVPRIAFVNKMDRVGADFYAAVESMRERLGANAHPIYIRLGPKTILKG